MQSLQTLLILSTINLFALSRPTPNANSIGGKGGSGGEYTLHEFKDLHGKSAFTLTSVGNARFSGAVTSPTGTSAFDSLSVQKDIGVQGEVTARAVTATKSIEGPIVKASQSIQAANAKFEISISVGESITGNDATFKGFVNATKGISSKGPIYAAGGIVSATGRVEAKALEVADFIRGSGKLYVGKDAVVDGKVVAEGGFLSKEGGVKANEVETSFLKVGQSAEFRGDVAFSKNVQVQDANVNSISVFNRLEISSKGSVSIEGPMVCNAKTTFSRGFEAMEDVKMDRASFSFIEFGPQQHPQQHHIKKTVIDASGGGIVASQLNVNDAIQTNNLSVDNEMKADQIASRELKVDGSSSLGNVQATGMQSKSLNAHSITSNITTVAQKLVAHTVQATDSISVTGNISSTANVFASDAKFSGDLSSKSVTTTSIEAVTVNASNKVSTKNLDVEGDILSSGSISSKGNITVDKELTVKGGIAASAITVGDLVVGSPFQPTRLGIMNVSSTNGVVIGGSLSIAGTANIEESLSVHDEIRVNSLSSNETITRRFNATEVFASGRIAAGNVTSVNGFYSVGDMNVRNVIAMGNVSAGEFITASKIYASKELLAPDASFEHLHVRTSMTVANTTAFQGDTSFSGGTYFMDNANFTGDLVWMNKLTVATAEIRNGLEVGSLFTKRVYTQDVAASGLITATSIYSKGEVNVTGFINSLEVSSERIRARDLITSDQLVTSTAKVEGALEAAGITAQKVTVKNDLIVSGTSLMNTIDQFEKRIADLERQLAAFVKDSA